MKPLFPALDVARRDLSRRTSAHGPVYLVSAGGQPNYGDELITRAWLDYLARLHPRVDVWLDSPEPGRAAHLFADTHPRLRTTNTLWQLAQVPVQSGVQGFEVISRVIRDLGSPKIDAGLRTLRTVRSVHLLGGGYVTSLWPRHLGLVMGMVALRRHFGVPIFATGQGWLPQDDECVAWLRGAVDDFVFVEARDRPSAATFEISHGVDDAYLAVGNRRRRMVSRNSPDVMLLLQGDMIHALGRDNALAILDRFLTDHGSRATVGVAEAIPPEDSWLLDDVRRIAPRAEFFPFGRIWDDGFPAREGQKWLTTRFHAHLVAASAGAAGTVFNVLPGYYDIKHELLIENGTGWAYASSAADLLERMPTPTRNAGFPDRARELSQLKREVARAIYA